MDEVTAFPRVACASATSEDAVMWSFGPRQLGVATRKAGPESRDWGNAAIPVPLAHSGCPVWGEIRTALEVLPKLKNIGPTR